MTKEERKICDELLDERYEELTEQAQVAFEEWRRRAERTLTEPQRKWLFGVAERLGVVTAAPSENLFSGMSPEKQAAQRKAAERIKLPWEK